MCPLIAAVKCDIIQGIVTFLLNSLNLFPFALAQSLDSLEPRDPWCLFPVASPMHLKYTCQF